MADDILPLLTFPDAGSLEQWLDQHGSTSPGVWLRFAKKGAAERTVSKSDAIDCALAYGWVDGQLGRVDEQFFKTLFTPRRSRSIWSQVNRDRVKALEQAGRMQQPGQAQVEHAKADGRWAAAYARQSEMMPDADFSAALYTEPSAHDLFAALDAANQFAIMFRIQQANTPAKRASKIAEMIAMLSRGKTFHSRRAKRGH